MTKPEQEFRTDKVVEGVECCKKLFCLRINEPSMGKIN